MAKHLPNDYMVRGGGSWLDIDYSNIDFNHAGVSRTPSADGYLVHGDEKTPSGLLSPGDVTVEIGMGFESRKIAKYELGRLQDFVNYNTYSKMAAPGERMCSYTLLGPDGGVEGEDVTFSRYAPENERTASSCTNLAAMTFLSLYGRDDPDETDRRYACDDRHHDPQQYCINLVRLDGRAECNHCGLVLDDGEACPHQMEHEAWWEEHRRSQEEAVASRRAGEVCIGCGVHRNYHHQTMHSTPDYRKHEFVDGKVMLIE